MKIIDSTKTEYYKKEITINIEKKEIKKEENIKKPTEKIDISILKKETEKTYDHLRRIVEDLLKRQGYSIGQLGKLNSEDIKVDQKARDEAKQMIEDDGPLSPEKVSSRIVDFAKSISGGDKSKYNLLKNAIEEGFKQAKKEYGDELPEISQKTYDLITEKLDKWYNE